MSAENTDPREPSSTTPAPASAPRRRRLLAWIGSTLAAVVAILGVAIGAAYWALHSPAGSAWLLGRVPGLTVVEPRGALIGDFAAARLAYVVGDAGELRLEAPRWRSLALRRGDRGRWVHLAIDSLHADRIVWVASPSTQPSAGPPTLPQSLRLPIEIEVREASVDELRIGGPDALPVRGVRARVHLGADGGARHRLDSLAAGIDRADARGAVAIGADAPFPVDAAIEAASTAQDWTASLRASGPIASLDTTVTARMRATATHPAPSLDARAVIRPLAPWPLGELQASVSAFDLSAFASAAPATSLTGQARATTRGVDVPATVSLDLANARAGRWNEGLLPVRRLVAELRARPDQPDIVDVEAVSADLGSAAAPGGSIVARGRWTPSAWNVDAELKQVRPMTLDARAAEAVIDGTATLVGSGFAAAAPALGASAPAPGASAPAPAASAPAPAGSAPAPVASTAATSGDVMAVALRADLAGRILDRRLPRAAPRTARLRLDGQWRANEIELRSAEASLGDARATLAGRLVRTEPAAAWRTSGRVELTRFDPAPWWPGAPEALFARGANRLNVRGEFDLRLPATSAGASALGALTATTGTAEIAIRDSVLAGVALQGSAGYVNPDGRARPALDLLAGGNRLQVEGTVGARGSSNDEWRVVVDAPRLDALAPFVGALAAPGAAGAGGARAAALAGTLALRGRVSGRWPDVNSQGELEATALRLPGATSIRRASGRWRLGSSDNAVLDGALVLDDVTVAGGAVDRIQAQVSGTARAHRLELRVASALLPPEWTDALATRTSASEASAPRTSEATASAPPPSSRSLLSVVAEGGLIDVDGERAGGWRGRLVELIARSTGSPSRTWLAARDVRAGVLWAGAPLRVRVEPGSAEVLGATLRWSRLAWQQGGAGTADRLDAQAEVDAIAVAPLLQTAQPGFGWGGDLRVGARLSVQSAPAVSVDMVIERAGGDLTVTDEISTQALGLSDLRLGVQAQEGVWHFTAAAAGATLGVASGAVTARTAATAMWPAAETPIEGVGELRVDSLGTWGAWLTPGWRLGGQLQATAGIGGRFGAPQYTGRIQGAGLSVRNFLEGVSVTDGTVAIALRGNTAEIETFTAKGGAGTLRLEGDAAFDASPSARLRLVLERFELLGRLDRRIVASGQAAMRLDAKTLALDGGMRVDEGLIDFTRSDAPTLGSDVEVVRRPPPPPPARPGTRAGASPASGAATRPTATAAPTPRDLALDLRVDMGERLRIRGRGLDAGLRGELHLTTPASRLALNGTLRVVDGTYQAYGQKLVVDRGVLTFVGPVENPRLDIEATRPNLDVRVGVAVSGTALNPRIRLFSEPELADLDKLSWLVLGRPSTTTGEADTALLQTAALALLSGEGPGVTDRLIQSIGLDEVSVRQSDGAVKDTIVTLGKQLSARWYVGYERGLNSTLGTWQLIYRVARSLTVRAEAGGDNAVDVIWTWRWN